MLGCMLTQAPAYLYLAGCCASSTWDCLFTVPFDVSAALAATRPVVPCGSCTGQCLTAPAIWQQWQCVQQARPQQHQRKPQRAAAAGVRGARVCLGCRHHRTAPQGGALPLRCVPIGELASCQKEFACSSHRWVPSLTCTRPTGSMPQPVGSQFVCHSTCCLPDSIPADLLGSCCLVCGTVQPRRWHSGGSPPAPRGHGFRAVSSGPFLDGHRPAGAEPLCRPGHELRGTTAHLSAPTRGGKLAACVAVACSSHASCAGTCWLLSALWNAATGRSVRITQLPVMCVCCLCLDLSWSGAAG